jgi:uncharacterized protein YndB with AHSA1/START domain
MVDAMDINERAPAIGEGEIQVVAPPETVWDVVADIDGWPQWNADVKSAQLAGPVAVGTAFRWKSGASSLTSTLQVVDRPNEIAWTGTTMGIKAIHVFRLRSEKGGTLVRSEESWEGLIARSLKGYSRKAIGRAIQHVLSGLKQEAERRAAA